MKALSVSSYTSIGGRENNEDSFGTWCEAGEAVAVVADGLGGHGHGKEASQIAVESLLTLREEPGLPLAETMREYLYFANEEILRTRPDRNQMKTTVVFLKIADGRAVWAHIGDSRLYHLYNGTLADITVDQSIAQLAVTAGKITRDQIPSHPDRNRLYQALGGDEIRPQIAGPCILAPGIHDFLLCSDGFWSYLPDRLIEDEWKASRTPDEWAQRLILQVESRAEIGCDNRTAVFVHAEI